MFVFACCCPLCAIFCCFQCVNFSSTSVICASHGTSKDSEETKAANITCIIGNAKSDAIFDNYNPDNMMWVIDASMDKTSNAIHHFLQKSSAPLDDDLFRLILGTIESVVTFVWHFESDEVHKRELLRLESGLTFMNTISSNKKRILSHKDDNDDIKRRINCKNLIISLDLLCELIGRFGAEKCDSGD